MVNLQKLSVFLLVVGALTLVSAAAQAVIIDDFQFGTYTLGREGFPMPYTVSDTQIDASGTHILGGQRDVTLEKISGGGTQPYTAMILGFGATYNSAFNCTAFWTIEYGLGGDLNADLTDNGGTALIIDVIGGDMGLSNPVRPTPLTLTVVSGSGTASHTIQLIDNQIYFIPFVNFPGVDFTDVDQVSFMVEQNPAFNDAIDFAIDFFGTDADLSVPVQESSWGSVKSLFR